MTTIPIDPFAVKRYSKLHPFRLCYTAYARGLDLRARFNHRPFAECIGNHRQAHYFAERGDGVPDTAVTINQQELLRLALVATEALGGSVAEVGSECGVTTRRLAQTTRRAVYAIDPYIIHDGEHPALVAFKRNTDDLPNVKLLRETSGQAVERLSGERFSLVFIDAAHDYANVRFDLAVWSKLLLPGGLVALHDVDDWAGVNKVCRHLLRHPTRFTLWGYCPNLAVLQASSQS